MEHDTQEWQRPWVAADGPAPTEPPPPAPATVPFVNDDPAATLRARGVDAEPPRAPTVVLPAPQPPPPHWGAGDHGPGSPLGSVRPPDTTGTVEAPTARPRGARRGIATALVAAIVGGVIGTAATLAVVRNTPAYQTNPTVQAPLVQAVGGTATNVVVAVAQAVTPSVVRVDVQNGAPATGDGGSSGVGSGVIYRSDGYIITNNHVVESADRIEVLFSDGESQPAQVIGTDPLNDLAVIRVERDGLPAFNIRREPPIQVGETAIAIGSPFGLEASVTAGVVSAVNRELRVPDDDGPGALLIPAVVQTDAAINPGNSGGALVDAEGKLIGINTAILTGSGGSQGVGFAISVESAIASADQLIEHGFVRHPFLGIGGRDMTREMAQRLGLDAPRGAVVEEVVDESGAATAGIEVGDVILAIDGDALTDMTELIVAIRTYLPGDTITLRVLRDGRERDVDVTLGERPR